MQATFDVLEERSPIARTEIPSGTRLFDWIVPDEWNLRDAYVAAPDGTRVVDYRTPRCTSSPTAEPVRTTLTLDELRERLHTLPEQPDVVPYRTSYYERTWGFCLSHRQLLELQPGDYEVVIDSTLEPGHLSFAEHRIEGEGDEEVLVSTYVCHPSLANDNLSGSPSRRCSPSACWAAAATHLPLPVRPRHDRPARLAPPEPRPADRIEHGLTVSCIGDEGNLTYKRSRRGDAEVDRAMETVLRDSGARTACSPGSRGVGTSASSARPGSTCRSAR